MDYFPAFLDLKDRPVLLVGGGSVARNKARLLAAAGARLTVVALTVDAGLVNLAQGREWVVVRREFRPTDVDGHWLVVSATGVAEVDRAVFTAASAARVFCNSVDVQQHCSYITPAIVDRGPVTVAISTGGAAPVLARNIRARIEALLPRGVAALAQLARRWRNRVRDAFDSVTERRRYWESVFSGSAAQLALNGDLVAAESRMRDLLVSQPEEMGEVWLVGAGPGDPGMLTLRAHEILQIADVIVHDRLVSEDVLNLARRDAERLSVGKRPGCTANSQEEINALLVRLVKDGKRVCRLKGGDPFVFGRGGEEMQALMDANLAVSVVPGITAAIGCAASAKIPLTHRGVSQSVTLVTAHGKDSIDNVDWAGLAQGKHTLAFYMAVNRFGAVTNQLVAHGRGADTPIAIVENGATPQQRVVTGNLGQLPILSEAHRIRAPAMLIVGNVAAIGLQATQPEAHPLPSYAKTPTRIAG